MGRSASELSGTVALTACSLLSPIGVGLDAFTDALRDHRSGRIDIAGRFDVPMPCAEACYIADFDVRAYLGKKGTSFFDRLTSLTIVACREALRERGLAVTDDNREQIGIVLGSAVGSIESIGAFTRETLIYDRPYLVNAILFPNTVMNCAAGQAAIWLMLKGVNATVSGGQTSGIHALRYAATAIRRRYADVLLVGGIEELSLQYAWGFHHSGLLAKATAPLGEGAAVFVMEDAAAVRAAGITPLAEVLACEVGAYGHLDRADGIARGLAHCIQRALARSGVSADEVWAVSGSFTGDADRDRIEEEGIGLALEHMPEHKLCVKEYIGECYSAAGAFQLAALLSLYRTLPGPGGRIALVTSIGHDGSVGCALIREGS